MMTVEAVKIIFKYGTFCFNYGELSVQKNFPFK